MVKILAVVAVIILSVQLFSANKAEPDLWGNVGFVTAFPWDNGFKYTNTFSFTEPDRPWINHEWLAQYTLHITHSRFGNAGLIALKIILGLSVVIMICLAMRASCESGIVKFLLLLLVISTIGYGFSARPHLFTYVLYALFLLALQRYQKLGAKWIFFLPLLGIIWVNLHGAFFIGILLLILYIIFEAIKKAYFTGAEKYKQKLLPLAVILIFLIAASFINPYGLRLWGFLFQSAAKTRHYLSEWAPFTLTVYLREHPDFILLCFFSFFAVWFSRKAKDITWLGILIVAFVSAVIMRRNIPLFAITAAFVVPEHIEDVAGNPLKRIFDRIPRFTLVAMLSGFIILSVLYTFIFRKANALEMEVPQERFPVAMLSFMKENNIRGNALVFFDWAEYCIWKTYPRCRVFLDGRFRSAYSVKTIDDYFDFLYLGRNWENALNNYDTDIILIHRGNPVRAKMLSRPEWALVCENEIACLFLKKGKHRAFFAKLEEDNLRYPEIKKYEYFP